MLNAETEIQRKQALLQANGALSTVYNSWRKRLLKIIAHLEAYIDFAEDENIEEETLVLIRTSLTELTNDMRAFLADGHRGQMRRCGVKTVILGAPNVGKSSFMNHLCRQPISIVADIPGTTRDIVETSFNIAGYPVVLADTAGLRQQTNDVIEMEGISRAIRYAQNVDLIILMMDAVAVQEHDFDVATYKRVYLQQLNLLDADGALMDKKCLIVANKIDLLSDEGAQRVQRLRQSQSSVDDRVLWVSCKADDGIDEALRQLEVLLKELYVSAGVLDTFQLN